MLTRTTSSATVAIVLAGLVLAGCATAGSGQSMPRSSAAAARNAVAGARTADACGGSGGPTPPTVRYEDLPPAGSFTVRTAAADGRAVRVGAGVIAFSDFTSANGTIDGGVIGSGAAGLVGAGRSSTTFEMQPRSSTKASSIPQTFPQTNQLSVLRADGAVSVLRGFTVRGTPQGHLYNGIRVSRLQHLHASDIRVVGVPGDAYSPPGETFGINDYRTLGSRWSHVVVDGAGVGASGFAANGSVDVRLCDVVSKRNRYAMGFAFWQTRDIRLVDAQALDNGYSGFNFERVSGTVEVVRPVARGNRYDFRIASDRGSAEFVIVDPVLVKGRFVVTLPKRWQGTANLQRRSDIRLIVGGKPRPDLLRFATP